MKRIVVLTSGGDAPGMSAAVRVVVRKTIKEGMGVFGINRGYAGIVEDNIFPLDAQGTSDTLSHGGTFLQSARYLEFATLEGQLAGIGQLKRHGVEDVIVIDGDSPYRGAMHLTEHGFPAIDVPSTIDNDIIGIDYTIGSDTAVNTAMEALSKIHDTSFSHKCAFVVKAMGRNAGDITLWSGIAVDADQIIIPEEEYDIKDVAAKAKDDYGNRSKERHLVVLAEDAMHTEKFAELTKKAGDTSNLRAANLGHILRGDAPSPHDRVLTSWMGAHAVGLLLKEHGGLAVGVHNEELVKSPILGTREEGALFSLAEDGSIIVNMPHETCLDLTELNRGIAHL